MSNDQPISRRDALMAATVLGAVAAVGQAQEQEPLDEVLTTKDNSQNAPLKVQITLSDGQIVTFNTKKAVITFGGGGAMVATPGGILPVIVPLDRRGNPLPTPREKPAFEDDVSGRDNS